MRSPSILVAMPAFNEESYVGTMVIKTKEYADEVLVVDDGSADATAKIARLAGATVVGNGKNLGYGATLQHILSEARKRSFDVLVVLDADTQHSPSDIPKLARLVIEGYDLVIGMRNHKDVPRYRVLGGSIISRFTNVLSKEKISDTQSGFRAFSVKAVKELQLKECGMAASSEMVSEASRLGLKMAEVPISIKYTKDGSTYNPIAQASNTLARILVMISKRKPLLFFGLGGISSVIAGLVIGIRSYEMLLANNVLPVGLALLSAMFLILGSISVFTGIILNAVNRE